MKTYQEIETWCAGAKKQFGDPARPVGQAFFRYQKPRPGPGSSLMVDPVGDLLLCSIEDPGLLLLFLEKDRGPMRLDIVGFFKPYRVTSGLWSLRPSLNAPHRIHIFVNIYDVPSPAPWWERFG